MMERVGGRRRFLAGAGMAVIAAPVLAAGKAGKKEEEEVAPGEDLMREHGVLKRALLVYRASANRLEKKQDVPPSVISDTAGLIRKFIEEYHEKLEEDHLFPRFRKAGKLVDLVSTLQTQHEAGRKLTARIEQAARDPKNDANRTSLIRDMRLFDRMYEPHEAREDTVLFPALHHIMSPHEYDAMGDQFEKIEHQKFGGEGFEQSVDQIARIEKTLGVYDLSQFTPRV